MRNVFTRPIQLPEELGMYVDMLRKAHPSIEEIWLLGPRVNGEDERGSGWELLAFADEAALAALRENQSVHRSDVHLSIVTDKDRFERAWGAPEHGRLSSIRWRVEDLHTATYARHGAARQAAVRVR
jgi:hypothetical protein